MINTKQIASQAAPILLIIGLLSMLDTFIPGFSVPGSSTDWMIAAVACALVGGAKA